MAAVAPPADQAADMLQKLSLDSKANAIEVPDSTKKVQHSVGSNNMVNGIQSDRSITPLLPDAMDPAVWYSPNGYLSTACYYGGSDAGNWEEYSRFTNQEGVDVTTGAYGDASLMYQHGYGYNLYAPYSPAASPVPTLAHDGQLYGAQQYQYPSPYFQSMTPTNSPYPNPANQVKGEMTTSAATEQAPLPVDSTNSKSNGNANNGGVKTNNGALLARPTYLNSSYNLSGAYGRGSLPGGIPASTYQDPRFAFDGLHSPIPWLESTYYPDGQPRPVTSSSMASSIANVNSLPPYRHQNFRHHLMGFNHPRPLSGLNSASGYINRMYPNTTKLYGQYGNAFRSGLGYGSNDYASRTSGRGWMAVDSKYKPRGRGNGFYCYGNESMDGLNELNRGPRTKSTTNSKGFAPVTLAVKGQSIPLSGTAESEKSTATPGREQYNRLDFPVSYTDAKFFIIKSYSEDDVHKSIKYSIWASTENGNKKLDAAFKEAEQNTGECPVFLFFSVNTSGQFVGVAEMVGPVDFNKNVEYWQQDKWIGCFPVKWHIVKDVPNSLLKHITLENNENKPVTNSRDTQEVKLEDGLKVLKIFKDHQCKQCVLDDFDFYEDRQKKIQERKGKLRQLQKQQTQIWEGKPTEANGQESINGDQKPHKAPEVVSDTIQVASTTTLLSNGDIKTAESSPVPNSGDVVKTAKAASVVPEKNHLANGVVANGC